MKYTCAMCNGDFESEWTEAEAIAEKERDFVTVSLEDCGVICDNCYQQISPKNNPDYYADYLAVEKPIRMNAQLPSLTEMEDTEVIRAYVDAELSRKLAEYFEPKT